MFEKLMDKIYKEQKDYENWLLTLSKEKILLHASDYAARCDIIFYMESICECECISEEDAELLLNTEDPIGKIKEYLENADLTDHVDLVIEAINYKIKKADTWVRG